MAVARVVPHLLPLVLSALLACNSASTGAPEILAVTPDDGAQGVHGGTNIEVSFSEPMNTASVESAYASFSDGLRREQVTFRWNANATKLTVDPNADLPIVDAPAPALEFGFVIGTGAADASGRTLAAPRVVSFKTIRRYEATLAGQAALDGFTSARTVTAYSSGVTTGSTARAGGMSDMVPDGFATVSVRAFFSFDLSGLPVTLAPADVTAATLAVEQVQVYPASAYADMTTAAEKLILEHVSYGSSLAPDDFATPALAVVTTSFFTDGTPARHSANVVEFVRDDVAARAARGSRSQFRLRFPKDQPEGNYGFADFATAEEEDAAKRPSLAITYLAP